MASDAVVRCGWINRGWMTYYWVFTDDPAGISRDWEPAVALVRNYLEVIGGEVVRNFGGPGRGRRLIGLRTDDRMDGSSNMGSVVDRMSGARHVGRPVFVRRVWGGNVGESLPAGDLVVNEYLDNVIDNVQY